MEFVSHRDLGHRRRALDIHTVPIDQAASLMFTIQGSFSISCTLKLNVKIDVEIWDGPEAVRTSAALSSNASSMYYRARHANISRQEREKQPVSFRAFSILPLVEKSHWSVVSRLDPILPVSPPPQHGRQCHISKANGIQVTPQPRQVQASTHPIPMRSLEQELNRLDGTLLSGPLSWW